jgi:hypothetical protein
MRLRRKLSPTQAAMKAMRDIPLAGPDGEVTHVEAILTPYPRPWRHPIRWWKARHLRADIAAQDELVSPEFREILDRKMDEAFLFGSGHVPECGEERSVFPMPELDPKLEHGIEIGRSFHREGLERIAKEEDRDFLVGRAHEDRVEEADVLPLLDEDVDP